MPAMRVVVSFAGVLGVLAVLGAGAAACAGSEPGETFDDGDSGPDAPMLQIEAGGGNDTGATTDANGTPDAADVTPPTRVTDLAGTPAGATSVTLTWTAPSDDSGSVTAYDLRVSATAMTTEAELLAGKQVMGVPMPGAAGAAQTATATGLDPETAYHFALRARDAAGNWSLVSNDATVTTKARATFQISEVALSNVAADGYDFIELTATKAGSAEGIEVKQVSTVLHTIAALDVALGDRLVVHMTTVAMAPAGFAQEDATKNKASSTAAFASATAYDVYSTTNGLTATDGILSVVDGTKALDSIVFANRDAAVATATMTALAAAKTAGQWTFAVTPADGVNDCETELDAVNVSTAATETPCGGFKSKLAAGISLNRVAGADTNTKADFYLAPQTPGAANGAVPAPTVIAATAGTATSVDLTFDQELAPASVVAASFTIPTLVVGTATASVNHVALATSAQSSGQYTVTMAATVTNLQGVAPSPLTAPFCGFSMVAPVLTLSEVNANLAGGSDLVELTVTTGGSLAGFVVKANGTANAADGNVLATLPAICAATGDIVVVHLSPAAAPATDETLAKDQFLNATYPQNYDAAWDVRGSTIGLGYTNQVLGIWSPGGAYLEAVSFSSRSATAPSATFLAGLTFAQAQGLWMPAKCGGAACDGASTPTAQAISVDWRNLDTAPAGASVRRIAPTSVAASWAVGASSFGAAN
jgi:hypothetical protein